MVSTFTVLAASMMLGQTSDAPVVSPQPAPKTYVYSGGVLVPATGPQTAVVAGDEIPEKKERPILSKIRAWFKRGENAPPPIIGGNDVKATVKPAVPVEETPLPSTDFPKKLPMTQSGKTRSDVTTASQKAKFDAPKTDTAKTEVVENLTLKPAPSTSTPILPANVNRIGRDEKFEWVTGQIEIEKGHFVLYYATPDTVDAHHGHVPLNPQKVDMRQFRSGDLISVQGQLRAGTYYLSSADLIERPKR